MAPHRKSYFYYNNYRFYKEKTFTSGLSSGQPKIRNYYKCSVKICKGRLVEFPIGTFNQTVEHTCELNENVRAKEAALGRLRERTLSVKGNVKAVELVRGVIRELPLEVRQLMPNEETLIKRVRKWAKANNIQLVRANPEDYLIQEGEEPLVGFSNTSLFPAAVFREDVNDSAVNTPVKNGLVYADPFGCHGDEDQKPSGLVFMKWKVDGHLRAVIEGQGYSWKEDLGTHRQLYACQESYCGCPVTVIVDNREMKYELRGLHVHTRKKIDKRKANKVKNIKRVDENGDEIGLATLDEFSATGWDGANEHRIGPSSILDIQLDKEQPEDFTPEFEEGGYTSDVDMGTLAEHQPREDSCKKASFRTVCTSSKTRDRLKHVGNAAKTGDRCFVCGDDLIISEALAASEQTFRKACCYLNVKANGNWFPKGKDSRYYSFCEYCTNEIIRISQLYKKVEELQSLIFKQIENMEKRIADAEIVDNWMADAQPTTARRYEGFRKQVMINYRNKLRVRREVRFGRKTGLSFQEIQPSMTAHMYARDPCETDAFRRVPDEVLQGNQTPKCTRSGPTGRNRAKPKSKKSVEEREEIDRKEYAYFLNHGVKTGVNDEYSQIHDNTSSNPEVQRKTRGRPKSKELEIVTKESEPLLRQNNLNDADCYNENSDAMSQTSEKELKFWVEDPTMLNVTRDTVVKSNVTTCAEDTESDRNDESDPDYNVDDFEWASGKPKITKPSLSGSEQPKAPGKIILESKRYRFQNRKHNKSSPKNVRESHCKDIKFPDAVLTKDGRVFMEGIEIIKNPPGSYKQRPYSVSFSCGACSKVSLGFWKIRQHICGHHLGMYKCSICFKQYSDPGAIDRHMIMFHGEGTHKVCEICEKPVRMFKSESVMRYHRWSHLNEEERKDPQYSSWCPPRERISYDPNARFVQSFMCDLCGKTFRIPSALKKHELIHEPGYEQQALMCQHCGKIFKNKKGLKQHITLCVRKLQGIVNSTRYPCPKCPTQFSSRATRSKHIKRFHSKVTNIDLPFSCPKCPRSFANRSAFKNHKRVCVDVEKGSNKSPGSESLQPSIDTLSNEVSHTAGAKSSTSSTQPSQKEGTQFSLPVPAATLLGYSFTAPGTFQSNNSL